MHAAPLPFSAPTLAHAPLWRAAVASETPCGNELNFANLILLGSQYHLQIAFHHHFIFRHYSHNPRFNGYGFPLACQSDDELNQALFHVEQDALFHHRPAQFCWLSPTQLAALQRLRPQQYKHQQQAANADYIYQQTDLASLPGALYRKNATELRIVKSYSMLIVPRGTSSRFKQKMPSTLSQLPKNGQKLSPNRMRPSCTASNKPLSFGMSSSSLVSSYGQMVSPADSPLFHKAMLAPPTFMSKNAALNSNTPTPCSSKPLRSCTKTHNSLTVKKI